jgi:hypothetical protein
MTNHCVADDKKQVAIFLLAVLEAVLNEQVKGKIIPHDVSKYVLDAVRDQAYRQGWGLLPSSNSTFAPRAICFV